MTPKAGISTAHADMLTTKATAVKTEGQSRVKPSERLSPMAQPVSNRPARMTSTQGERSMAEPP